jgi:hypothetical protein
LLIKKFIDFIE